MVARGRYIMFADADGATKFSEYEKIEKQLEKILRGNRYGIVCGSRAHLQGEAITKRSLTRNILMWGFHFLVKSLGRVKRIQDTQCGFKVFSREAAHHVFPYLHIERWAFDVELLWLAQHSGIPMEEIQVIWQEVDGSHLEEEDTRVVSIKMFCDILRLRISYILGLWARPTVLTVKDM
eukprot:TRINITY_DN1133_c0_g1_i7.p1 TRINITY_DN1133_c0_g1~~TRINITY_DN1133_c0_g1_i7.p1  ORF type:complete len:179 (-),score=23.46 TRINITY_DN1133_c0_g1_i7:127-663(-)